MSLVPYGLVRPFLFGMDAEAAHDFTLQALARTQGTPLQLAYAQAQVADPVTIAGLRFPNRVGLAAGGHGHPPGAKRQPQAAHVPLIQGPGADQPHGL